MAKTTIPIPNDYWNPLKEVKTNHKEGWADIACECGARLLVFYDGPYARCECGRVYRVLLDIQVYTPVMPCPHCGFEMVDGRGCINMGCISKGEKRWTSGSY